MSSTTIQNGANMILRFLVLCLLLQFSQLIHASTSSIVCNPTNVKTENVLQVDKKGNRRKSYPGTVWNCEGGNIKEGRVSGYMSRRDYSRNHPSSISLSCFDPSSSDDFIYKR